MMEVQTYGMVGILPLLLLVGVVIGVVMLIVRLASGGKKSSPVADQYSPEPQARRAPVAGIIGGVIAVVVALLVVGLFSASNVPITSSHNFSHGNTSVIAPPTFSDEQASPAVVPAVWQDDIELEFGVDSYSSARLAATALLRDMVRSGKLQKAREAVEDCGNVYLYLDRPVTVDLSAEELQMLADDVKSELADYTIDIGVIQKGQLAEIKAANPNAVFIAVGTDGYSRSSGLGVEVYEATLTCTISCGSYSNTDSRKFSQANWMADYVGYCREMGPAMTVVTGSSQQSCPDIDTARQQALDNAAMKLNQSVSGASFAAGDLSKINAVRDIFIQELKGTAGSVFRAKVLVAQEQKFLQAWVKEHQPGSIDIPETEPMPRYGMSSWASLVKDMLMLLAAVVGCYLICDFMTKGYYKGRIAIILIILAIIIGATMFA